MKPAKSGKAGVVIAITASVFGFILVIGAIGALIDSHPSTSSTTSSPYSSAPQAAPSPTLSPEERRAQEERRRAEEAARLDRSTYEAIAPREIALLAQEFGCLQGSEIH